jgi:putative component of membrane protein insertase Oxa1/YidC/SpoIIIJ protein YidD
MHIQNCSADSKRVIEEKGFFQGLELSIVAILKANGLN